MYALIDITQQLDLTPPTTKVISVEEQMWAYHEILDPKIILVSEFEDLHTRGWERTPAVFSERKRLEQEQQAKKEADQLKSHNAGAQEHTKTVVTKTDDQHKKEDHRHRRVPDLESFIRDASVKKHGPNR
jgi:hypothetical protein